MPSERSGPERRLAQSYATPQPTKMAEISVGRREEEYQNNELRGFTCSSPSESFEQAEPEIDIKDANKSPK